jgi:hypothetical protein
MTSVCLMPYPPLPIFGNANIDGAFIRPSSSEWRRLVVESGPEFESLVQTPSGAVIFMPCSLGTNGLQPYHTRSMSPSDLELQHNQVSVLLSVIQHSIPVLPLLSESPSENAHILLLNYVYYQ